MNQDTSFQNVMGKILEFGAGQMQIEVQAIVPKEEAKGHRYEGDQRNSTFDHEYIDQIPGGGLTGDSFSGHAYFPVGGDMYAKVWYSC